MRSRVLDRAEGVHFRVCSSIVAKPQRECDREANQERLSQEMEGVFQAKGVWSLGEAEVLTTDCEEDGETRQDPKENLLKTSSASMHLFPGNRGKPPQVHLPQVNAFNDGSTWVAQGQRIFLLLPSSPRGSIHHSSCLLQA